MFTYRKFVNALVFVISILTVNLLTDRITTYLLAYKHITHPAKATLIGMLLVVIVLYPAFKWIDDLCDKLTKNYFKAGKNAAGKILGTILTFLVALSILFFFYLKLWFGVSVWNFL